MFSDKLTDVVTIEVHLNINSIKGHEKILKKRMTKISLIFSFIKTNHFFSGQVLKGMVCIQGRSVPANKGPAHSVNQIWLPLSLPHPYHISVCMWLCVDVRAFRRCREKARSAVVQLVMITSSCLDRSEPRLSSENCGSVLTATHHLYRTMCLWEVPFFPLFIYYMCNSLFVVYTSTCFIYWSVFMKLLEYVFFSFTHHILYFLLQKQLLHCLRSV